MYPGPSRTAEAIVAVFVPPACREEALGDQPERYNPSGQYGLDALARPPRSGVGSDIQDATRPLSSNRPSVT
jgi:hypothetical protein